MFLVHALVAALRLALAAQSGWACAPHLDAAKPWQISDYAYEQRAAASSMARTDVALAAMQETPRLQWFRW